MSSMPHESDPTPETKPTVTLDEARTEINATIESVIYSAINKAIKMDIGGIEDTAECIINNKQLTDEQINALSPKGKRLLTAIDSLRQKQPLLSGGLREDVTNEELVGLVDWLSGFNEAWKSAIDNKDVVKNTDDLILVVARSGLGIQSKMSIGYEALLTKEAKQELGKLLSLQDS